MRSLTTCILLVLSASVVSAQTDLSLALPGYRVAIAGPLVEGSGGGWVAGQLDSLPRDRRTARFGVLFPADAALPVLEVHDGVSGATLATVTAAQWLGRESSGWKRIPDRSTATGDRMVDAFAVRQGKTSLTIIRTLERVTGSHLPLGSGLRLSVGVADASVPSVRLVVRGMLEGAAVLNGSLLTVASTEKPVPMNATMLMLWSEGASVRLEGAAKLRSLVVRSDAVSATSPAAVHAVAVTVAGTTSPVREHQTAQGVALLEHAKGRPARPLLVARTVVDKPKASPGDTVSYELTYYNVGTAPATEVELSNPVPPGTLYLDASARGFNSEITAEREKVAPPAVGRVIHLHWQFKGAIAPGGSRWASFKVMVQ